MSTANWEPWEVEREHAHQSRRDRFPLMRPVRYELSEPIGQGAHGGGKGQGLTVNVSSGGMCLLMDHTLALQDVLRVHVPMTILVAHAPTLAEVRWRRTLPFERNGIHVVGLKFLL